MKSISKIFLSALVFSLGSVQIAQARTITSISPPSGEGLGETFCPQVMASIDTPQPNNGDTSTPSPNQLPNFPNPLSCTPINFKAIAPVDSVVSVESSGGTTEYFVKQTIVNQTNETWKSINFKIGFGTGNDFAGPEAILFPTGVQLPFFDTTPIPTSSKFGEGVLDGSFNINWVDGMVEPGESVDFTYSLTTPDDLSGKNLYQTFTIRQTPIPVVPEPTSVPEPSSIFALLTLGSVTIFSRKYLARS